MNEVECPYCENYIEVTYDDHDGQEEFDLECPHCEKEFQVNVDWQPIYNSSEIVYKTCEECGKEFRYNGWVLPRPSKYKNISWDDYTSMALCKCCYRKSIYDDILNKRG